MNPEQKAQIEQILRYGHDYIIFPEEAKDLPLQFDILKKNETEWHTLQDLMDIFGYKFQAVDILRSPFKLIRWAFDRDEGYSEDHAILFFESHGYVNIKTPDMKIYELDFSAVPDNGFGLFSELEIQYIKANT